MVVVSAKFLCEEGMRNGGQLHNSRGCEFSDCILLHFSPTHVLLWGLLCVLSDGLFFKFNPSSECHRENIEVYDGPTIFSRFLGRVCNSHESVPVFHATSGALTFRITTDSTDFVRNIFAFYYYITPDSSNIKGCGGYLTGPDGSFTSPNYPLSHPEFAYCVWYIETEKHSTIHLTFSDIFLEMDDKCRFDFLAIYDGPTTSSGLIKQVCGLQPQTFESSSNVMTVALSTDYANSYRGFSASYRSIPISQPNTSLSCSSDTMTVTLSKSHLELLGYNGNDLTLNDPACRPIALNPVIFSFSLNGCGTLKKSDGHTISYSNTIAASPMGDIITRQKHIEITVQCIMENNSTVEVIYITENESQYNTSALGRYNLSMSFYESGSFSTEIFDSPYYVDLNQTLYAQVSLHSTDPNLLVFVDTCTASPNPNSESPLYDLVTNGCAKDSSYVAYPLLEHYGRFRFSSFKFLRSLPSVYLHCEVLICDSSNRNSRCTQGCISRHKREVPLYKWKGKTMVGPLRLKGDHNPIGRSDSSIQVYPEESQNAQSKSMNTLTFVVLVTNAVLLAGLAAKHLISCKPGHRNQKLQSY
nr:CUB and zona pellucida-like domain-containing protein 1 [Pogona vitticeps]